MLGMGGMFTNRRLLQRADWAVKRDHPLGPPTRGGGAAPRAPWSRPPEAWASTGDHLFFSVRSFWAGADAHTLQFGFVDSRANIVLSVFAKVPSPVRTIGPEAIEDLPVEPLDPDALDRLLVPLCRGVVLVSFQRVLQAGLLPTAAVQSAASLQCAWRRFGEVAETRGVRAGPGCTLNDALAVAGKPPLDTEDAALRALAVRDLWAWMDVVA